jgi:hypothetical protein
MTSDTVIDPVLADLRASIPRMKTIPEICPARSSRPFDVPSGAGEVTSAPYWKPSGPDESRNAPRTNAEASRSP